MIIRFISVIVFILCLGACGSSDSSGSQVVLIEDLPFVNATDAKHYADLVIKAVRTNRSKPIADEFAPDAAINLVKFNRLVMMYSTGIGGRKDWEYYDFHELSGSSDQTVGFDYGWLDPKGRLGLQIYVRPKHNGTKFYIDHLEFRSRIDVIDSAAFPDGDEIDDYKKVKFDWDEAAKSKKN
jgi:hypothetical protein